MSQVESTPFGTVDGKEVSLYTLDRGIRVRITNFGGIIVSLEVPVKGGKLLDVALGYYSLEPYLKDTNYFGAIIGRYANRIAKGRFKIADQSYQLPVNLKPHHIHGGKKGFSKVVWDATVDEKSNYPILDLDYLSPDGEEGYPGNLRVKVRYSLPRDYTLNISYFAISDNPTIINLTNHSYFNLKGQGAGNILDHKVQIYTSHYTPSNRSLIPTGEITSVEGTPFDLRQAVPIRDRIFEKHPQLRYGNGFDHNFVIDGEEDTLRPAARIIEPESGREMNVITSMPGMQFYCGNHFDGVKGKGGKKYEQYSGFAFETQYFPDSPNHPDFPSTILDAYNEYRTETRFRFKP